MYKVDEVTNNFMMTQQGEILDAYFCMFVWGLVVFLLVVGLIRWLRARDNGR